MKTLFLFTLSITLSLTLSARENPFAATNAYEEEAARIIELNEIDEAAYDQEQFVQDMQEQMSVTKEFQQENENKNIVEEAVNKLMPALKEEPKKMDEKKFSEKEVKKLIKKAQAQTEAKTKKLIEKKLENAKPVEPKQIVFVKPRPDVEMMEDKVTDEMKINQILPFVKLEYNNNELTIHTKYKVSKKFSIKKDNKIIIDYKAKVNFYTKRDDLSSMNFKKVALGNHKKNGFFRVVVELDKKPNNYKVNYKKGLITIVKSNEM